MGSRKMLSIWRPGFWFGGRKRNRKWKRNGKLINIRTKRNNFKMSPFSGKVLKSLVSQTKDNFPTEISSEHHESDIFVGKKDISSMTVPLEVWDNFGFTYERDWDITGKTKSISVQGRLKVNIEYWKNKLRSYFVESVINNGYIIPFPSAESPFYASINKSSLRHSQFILQAFTKLLENNCQKTQTKTLLL